MVYVHRIRANEDHPLPQAYLNVRRHFGRDPKVGTFTTIEEVTVTRFSTLDAILMRFL